MMTGWMIRSFEQLTCFELYQILRLRSAVFVVEQNCVFPEIDGKDVGSHHVFKSSGEEVIAYSRILSPGVAYSFPSIGRVCTHQRYRGTGLGKELMEASLQYCLELYAGQPIQIGAQLYLKSFYAGFGFTSNGEIYLEDGIEHIPMIKRQ